MKALHVFFYIGAGLDLLMLLIVAFSMADLLNLPQGHTGIALAYIGVVFLVLAIFASLAFWFKNKGNLVLANVVIWLPAIPLILTMGFALLFIIHDIFYK